MAVRTMSAKITLCQDPTDRDVVKGVLAEMFAAARPHFAARKLEERLADEGMCHVTLLQVVTVEMLCARGMTLGEALFVDRVVFPPGAQAPLVVVTPPLVAALDVVTPPLVAALDIVTPPLVTALDVVTPPLVAALDVAFVCSGLCAVCAVLETGDVGHTLPEEAAEACVQALRAPQGKKGNINLTSEKSLNSRSTAVSIIENQDSSPCGELNKDIDALSALINIDALSVSINKDIDALSASINIDALSVSINKDIDALSASINKDNDALSVLFNDIVDISNNRNVDDDIVNNNKVDREAHVPHGDKVSEIRETASPPKPPNKPLP
jgi:hypothetical protein